MYILWIVEVMSFKLSGGVGHSHSHAHSNEAPQCNSVVNNEITVKALVRSRRGTGNLNF